jgi:hypothetical protein
MKLGNKNRGFSAVEVIVLVVIVGFVGFFGWSVWHAKNKMHGTPNTASQIQNSVTSKWKVFQDSHYAFQFEYPQEWTIENQQNTTEVLILKNKANDEIITIDTRVNPAVVGISFCGAYPRDKRCEVLRTESGHFVTVDWGVDGEANAMFSSKDGRYGVSFTLHRIDAETTKTFRQILSTFKFVK